MKLSNRTFDLVVVGGTPGGIACAVRAAREGAAVLLTNRHEHLGGILSSGLAVWDTIWEGNRSPIYDEVRAAIFEYYRTTYGETSAQYLDSLPAKVGHLIGRFEASVAEKVLTDIVLRESNVTLVTSVVPVKVERSDRLIQSLTLKHVSDGSETTVSAGTFADCTYEGDLAALAKIPYRVGREARCEFNEPHAGIIFMRPVSTPPSPEAAALAVLHDKLNLRKFSGWQVLMPQSTGAADPSVQACNYRTTLTTVAENRLPIPKPAHYAPYYFRSLEIFAGIECVPNDKFGWNRPQLVGRQTAFIEADWATRQRIMDDHWDMTMGLLYFLQHDLTVPSIVRQAWLQFGLPKDEFADNGHRPYEMYIREARRIVGRSTFTQHDAMLAPETHRAPVYADSVGMTEWYLDSHSCTTARVPDGLEEGKVMLHQETFPGQVAYRCLLSPDLDNLLVPVCVSSTHLGWNAVRLEPVFMQVGESAGTAVAIAIKHKTTVAEIGTDELVRSLCRQRSMVTFFNDLDVHGKEDWIPGFQYFGTKGFFSTYDAKANEPLKLSTARVWSEAFGQLGTASFNPQQVARAVMKAESSETLPITIGAFATSNANFRPKGVSGSESPITRGEAIGILWEALG